MSDTIICDVVKHHRLPSEQNTTGSFLVLRCHTYRPILQLPVRREIRLERPTASGDDSAGDEQSRSSGAVDTTRRQYQQLVD